MSRFAIFILSAVLALSSGLCFAIEQQSQKSAPNIVVLFSDDAGYSDFGFQPTVRDEMKSLTPHIDSIAIDGVRCSNAYMSGCVCSPSRAGLMTGRYQNRFGFDNNLPPGTRNGLSLEETFIAKRLQAMDYSTALIGKWHLGYPEKFHPNERGFDWFYGCLQGSRSYFPMNKTTPHRVVLDNKMPTEETGYVTDRIGDAAVRFIGKQKDQPFFLFVSFTAPHGPLQAKPEDLEATRHIAVRKRQTYAAMVKSLDDNVGKILEALKTQGVENNTLVIFTNDNGGQTLTGAVNLPLRERKGTLYEGGVRVPWVMKWPGVIAEGTAFDSPVSALDLAPTFVQLAGGTVEPAWELDGTSLVPIITGEKAELPTRTLFWRKGGSAGTIAARKGDWKLVHRRETDGAKPELYNLANDVSEEKDVAGENADRLSEILGEIQTWETQMVEPAWGTSTKNNRKNKQ